MGGETISSMRCRASRRGLSPRGRGNLYRIDVARYEGGSIPAWAGKPRSGRRICQSPAVYPRVGGETERDSGLPAYLGGLSPRGRGNLPELLGTADPGRSIPAWAGKPRRLPAGPGAPAVYPRVGGETAITQLRGVIKTGLSPRGRGNPVRSSLAADDPGSIPAWAGKPGGSLLVSACRQVYPRVGGETDGICWKVLESLGLSPRGRGNPILRSR